MEEIPILLIAHLGPGARAQRKNLPALVEAAVQHLPTSRFPALFAAFRLVPSSSSEVRDDACSPAQLDVKVKSEDGMNRVSIESMAEGGTCIHSLSV
jgi:hypothetical protein